MFICYPPGCSRCDHVGEEVARNDRLEMGWTETKPYYRPRKKRTKRRGGELRNGANKEDDNIVSRDARFY